MNKRSTRRRGKRHIGRLVLMATLLAASPLAAAQTRPAADKVTLAGHDIILDPPAGYCLLDHAKPREGELIDQQAQLQGTRNKLVMSFADCGELGDFRDGKRDDFTHHGIVLAVLHEGEVRTIGNLSREDFIAQIAHEIPAIDVEKTMQEVRDASGGKAQISELKNLGILDHNADALFVGFVITGADRTSPIVTVMGMTLLNEVPLSLYLYQPLAEPLDPLLAAQKRNLHELVAANAALEPMHWFWGGIDWWPVLIAAATGAAVLGGIGFLWQGVARLLLRRRTAA